MRSIFLQKKIYDIIRYYHFLFGINMHTLVISMSNYSFFTKRFWSLGILWFMRNSKNVFNCVCNADLHDMWLQGVGSYFNIAGRLLIWFVLAKFRTYNNRPFIAQLMLQAGEDLCSVVDSDELMDGTYVNKYTNSNKRISYADVNFLSVFYTAVWNADK